ncbi:MAG TPA: arginine--tRNA ligase [Nitrososphaeraceae archaeon]|nr:arginine--tRNA ligase [Nitrososphaeraceae archaeon]
MSFKKFISESNEVIKYALGKLNIKNESYTLTEPTKDEFGDLSCNVAFLLTKELQKSPYTIASMLVEQYPQLLNGKNPESQSYVSSVVAHESGYINFKANFTLIGKEIIADILKNDYTYLDIGKNKKVIIEHTSVNPNKALHVGHLRNVAIGDTLYRILKNTNHDVTVLNYVDDSGLQVADILVGFLYLGFPMKPANSNIKFDLYCGNEIYVKVNELYEKDPSLIEKRKSLLKKLEEGDSEIISFASDITAKVLKDQLKTCWRMKARYDLLNFESHIISSKLWEKTFEKMRAENIVTKETEGENMGCWVFDSIDEGSKIIVRSDGTATYIAKDIPYALLKVGTIEDPFVYKVFIKQWDDTILWISTTDDLKDTTQPFFFPAEDSITVIDNRQTRLQKIIKEILNKFELKLNRYMHLSYGPVLLSSGTAKTLDINHDNVKSVQMSGRKGIYVNADFVLDTLYGKAKEETMKRNPEITGKELERTSEEIAISAMRYSLIKNDLEKEIKFDMIDSLSLDGNSGPYLQYAYARCCRLIEKSNAISFSGDVSHLSDRIEFRLIKHLSKYAIVIEDATKNMEPKLIAQYAYELATLFNLFYEKLPILKESDADISEARISLVEAIRKMLEINISLVGITPLERM